MSVLYEPHQLPAVALALVMQVAAHTGQLQRPGSPWQLQRFGAAAAVLSASAAAGRISAEQTLEAAAMLSARVMRRWEDVAAACDEARLDSAHAAAVPGTCKQHIASAAAASAAAVP